MSDTLTIELPRGIRVNRLIIFAMLISFAAQQFACCCVDVCASVCEGDYSTQAICKTVDSGYCDCGHHDHETNEIGATGHDEEHPADGHQHHVCVGTHLFYLTAERFDVSQLVLIPGFDLCLTVDFAGLWSMINSSTNRDRSDDVPWRSVGPERSILCVYRI